jgi:hypothetical protein|tara:strand:+ start:344 stop:592 length:249 start_codon:yes stop_codon:yes gene_type:complete
MILSTREQAINFCIYAMTHDDSMRRMWEAWDDGRNSETLEPFVEELRDAVCRVFGTYTFEHDMLEHVVLMAIQHHDEAENRW